MNIEQELAAAAAAWKDANEGKAGGWVAERLSTTVSRRHATPFTTDPIGDARVIVEYLTANREVKT